jgi:hypothetical protein
MNAPFERSPKPDLSLEHGELGDAFNALVGSRSFTTEYGEKVRESFRTLVVRLDPAQVRWDNYELAMQQLDGLRDFLWGGIDPIVRLFTPCTEANGTAMQGNNLESWLDIACDEKTIKGSQETHPACSRRGDGRDCQPAGACERRLQSEDPKDEERGLPRQASR